MSYLEIGFLPWTKARDRPYRFLDALARVSGIAATAPWSDRAGPLDVDYSAWTMCFPALWGVNEPTNDSIGPGSTDITEAPRNSNNHTGENNMNVIQFNHWHHL